MAAVRSEASPLLPLLETLEDSSTSHAEQTDAYLSIASRLTGEDSKDFIPLVEGQFLRLCKLFKVHISSQNSDLSNAALQLLGFCVFNNKIASSLSASEIEELLLALNSLAVQSTDKNTCTRALWVISKQNFPSEEVGKAVPSILSTLESVLTKDIQSLVIEYEALSVVVRLLEQAPTQMADEAVRWVKLIIPLVVHSAPKVRLRSATALEMGMPLLLNKQQEVAAVTEQLMSSKIIAELQKLFSSKNETYVLKLWPLFVRLLGKTLHRSGTFINSLLQLEELGFRSGSPAVKKIAFIAWKSLIDNFALNPEILCSTKRLKLLMQPLSSIHVRTEALALTKIEVWWYLLMRLGSQLHVHFEQVCLPLLQSALSSESSPPQATPLKGHNQSLTASTPLQKASFTFGSPTTPKISLNTSLLTSVAFPSVHLLGIEMILHFLLGPEVVQFANKHRIVLNLEPLQHPLINSSAFFCKHAAILLSSVQDGFIVIGKDASGAVINAVWKDIIEFVKAAMDTAGKKERQGSDVLTYLLQSLKNIVTSDVLQAEKSLSLLECTTKGLPQKVLGSAAYQVANMDLLNGTPALFLLQLHFHAKLLQHGVTTERFFINFETLVSYVLSGQTSPLAFSESVLGELNQSEKILENKEHLWRMWSILINPLTECINQTNEVNQGDALEHNFNAMHSALMLPITHIFPDEGFPLPTIKTLMRTWSELYKAFARCSALVTTTEENVGCEELCSKILSHLGDCPLTLPLLERTVQAVTVIVECINFAPYTTKFQPKTKAPHTPTDWSKRKKEPLGNLNSLLKLFIKLLDCFHIVSADESVLEVSSQSLVSIGTSVIGLLSTCISHITLPSLLRMVFVMLTKSISPFYEKNKSEAPKVYSSLGNKLDKLLGDILLCLGSRYNGSYDNELLEALSPLLCTIFLHKNKQIRNQVAQFWNGSFAKTTVLLYPEELKPVLCQVKSKMPLLLPGFTFSNTSEELSGQCSDNTDHIHLETKVSGIQVKSAGKRDSLMPRTEEIKENGMPTRSPQVKVKLDFSSPKRKLLEEEHSADFVFIPPETKERVLTEHQKEVLRTKRVDIPAMYNNLDASQDTSLFSQYSQSQDVEKPVVPEELKESTTETQEKNPEMLPVESVSTEEIKQSIKDEIKVAMSDDKEQPSEIINGSPVKEQSTEAQNASNISNTSTSSDMVLGTPPQPTSRRQSFITLEKFEKTINRSFSPLQNARFPKLSDDVLVPDSQEATNSNCPPNVDENEDAKGALENTKQKDNTNPITADLPKSASRKGRRSRSSKADKNTENKHGVSEEVNPENTKESVTKVESNSETLEEKPCFVDCEAREVEPKPIELAGGSKAGNSVTKNVECKENTPPETVDSNKESSQVAQTISTNQTFLRRSSRRQSEILEGVQNVNGNLKQEQTEEEKIGPKKIPPPKEMTRGQKREKLGKSQKEDREQDKTLDQSVTQPLPEDAKTDEKAKAADLKQDVDLPDSNSSKDSQEVVTRSRPRYQTRRSLQALLTGSENSESDCSETREEGVKRKRTPKSKPKSTGHVGKESSQQFVTDSEPISEPQNLESGSEMDVETKKSQALGIDNKTYTVLTDSSSLHTKTLTAEPGTVPDLSSCTREVNQTCDVTKNATVESSTMQSLMTESTAEPGIIQDLPSSTREVNQTYVTKTLTTESSTMQSLMTESTAEPGIIQDLPSSTREVNQTYDVTKTLTTESSTMQSLMTESTAEPGIIQDLPSSTIEVNQTYDVTKTLTTESSTMQSLMTESTAEPGIIQDLPSSTREVNQTYDVTKTLTTESSTMQSLMTESGIIQDLPSSTIEVDQTYDVTKTAPTESSTMQSLMTEPSAGDFSTATSDVFQHSEIKRNSESFICSHKRSKRLRRSKACDCCGEAPRHQEKTNTEPTSCEGEAVKHKKKPLNLMVSQVASDSQLDDTDFSGPCAVSTPLTTEKEDPCFFQPGVSAVKSDTESEQENTVVPCNEHSSEVEVTQILAETKTLEAPEVFVEPKDCETLVSSESEEGPPENADLATECVQELSVELEDPSVSGLKEDTNRYKTYDVDVTVSATNADGEEMESVVDKSPVAAGDYILADTELVESSDTAVETDCLAVPENEIAEDALLAVTTEQCTVFINSENTDCAPPGRADTDSPPKIKDLAVLAMANDSPGGHCSWSPLASPSTSILKKGLKRQQEMDSPSPVNKIRRVSFADPIYQEGLADDIDRRSPVVRSHSSNNSPSSRSLKMLTICQPKLNTTPTKGFVSPTSRVLGFKSSKKNLISEMTKESMPSPKESVYPALMNCTTPVDVILPQITSNMWARGLGQLIRAKNIKTIGDLSTLTPSEIKTLPIRSPKISTVKKALRVYHEQQTKTKGFGEFAALDETEKPVNGVEEKSCSAEEEKIATDVIEQSATALDTPTPPDILAQINSLSLQLPSDDLGKYSGTQLFEMHEKLGIMSTCILKHLQSRWRSPPHTNSL
ncbi:telomere-associated protein RIF1 [Pelodytes ibericus]